MRFLTAACVAALMCSALPLAARDLALVVDQQNYRSLKDLSRDARLESISDVLSAAEFDVTELNDATLGELRAGIFSLENAVQSDVERLVIVLRGQMLSDGRQSWLLAQEARSPDRFDIGSKAVPLSLLDRALSAAAGRAVLIVIDNSRPLDDADGLSAAPLAYMAQQGTTVIKGSSRDVQAALRSLLQEGGTTRALADTGDLEVSGFISGNVAFTPVASIQAPAPVVATPKADTGELAYWSAVRDIGSKPALQSYIDRYPNGDFVSDARALMQAQEVNRETQLKEAEQALGLARDQRREIQRNLALLGYNPRGIDGVFGPATRRAVAAWQTDQRLEPHGYLDRDQLQLMDEFAMRRAAELEEEARRRREIEEARDRAYWQDTGARNTEAGYRQYLKEFPDGVFAELAREELDAIEAERRAEMDARERNAWDTARNQNTVNSYQVFLRDFPDGVFAEAAKSRIDELTNEADNSEARAQYQARENAVAGGGAARMIVESRLSNLGLKPGAVDGSFTKDTRRALRRFQKARNLTVTGYVDQATMVQLLLGR